MKENKLNKLFQRDLAADLIKVLCMFYITGFNHLSNYGNVYNPKFYISQEITTSALLTFMFFGGFFFPQKELSLRNIKDFYKRRAYRFYFLYLLSILTLFAGGLILQKSWFFDYTQLFLTIVGLSSFYQPAVPTLWFMSMLMFFYVITPLLKTPKMGNNLIAASIIFFFLTAIVIIEPSKVDNRILIYFLFYAMGVLVPKHIYEIIKTSWISFFTGLMVFLFFSIKMHTEELPSLISCIFQFLYVVGFILMALSISSFIINRVNIGGRVLDLFSFLSYIQLSMYLFHRHIYMSIEHFLEYCGIQISIFILILLFIPTCIIVSFYIQYCYDIIIRNIRVTQKHLTL